MKREDAVAWMAGAFVIAVIIYAVWALWKAEGLF